MHLLVLQFAHPFRHDDGGEDVAEQIGDGADLGHEALDAQQEGQARRRQDSERRQGRGQRDEAGAGDPRRPFEVDSITNSIISC